MSRKCYMRCSVTITPFFSAKFAGSAQASTFFIILHTTIVSLWGTCGVFAFAAQSIVVLQGYKLHCADA